METPQTAASIAAMFKAADAREFAVLERSFAADTRRTVQNAINAARKRLEAEALEEQRVREMLEFEGSLAGGRVLVGLDEVGRGPLAGPLAVGAVVLPQDAVIAGLNDSKQLSEKKRSELAEQIKAQALGWSVQYVQPADIDSHGMTACLKAAFSAAVADIEAQGIMPEVILLDGNPLRFDPREVNVVKGDAKCASIAAASIIAKVERDSLMVRYSAEYSQYGFESNKGYGSAQHQEAIRQFGLTPIHRASFCRAFTQETLF